MGSMLLATSAAIVLALAAAPAVLGPLEDSQAATAGGIGGAAGPNIGGPHSFAVRLVVREANDDPDEAPPVSGAVRVPQADGADLWLVGPDILTADMIVDAASAVNPMTGLPDVSVRISEDGQRRFAEATRKYVNWQFAIVVDGVVVSAPYIGTPIDQQDIEISGTFTPEEANDLAQAILKSRAPSKP